MAYAYDEPRAHQLREPYHAAFGGDELPVPVEAIAEDLLGLAVEVRNDLPVSGMLLPSERRIVVRSDESEPRRRFTIAHELGHWICQCLEGDMQPVYCRAAEIGVDAAAKALEREANVFAANLLMPEPVVRAAWAEAGTVEATASLFDVSPEAMEWRLFNCGFVGDPPTPRPSPRSRRLGVIWRQIAQRSSRSARCGATSVYACEQERRPVQSRFEPLVGRRDAARAQRARESVSEERWSMCRRPTPARMRKGGKSGLRNAICWQFQVLAIQRDRKTGEDEAI